MTVKPIAAGTPQRIISKINEIINAVNTGGGSGGSGTADAILDAATIADAGKALGIDAEGEPALIEVSGGESPVLICHITYESTGSETDPFIGHISNATSLLDAIDHETEYNPIIAFYADLEGDTKQYTPTFAIHKSGEQGGIAFVQNGLYAYGAVSTANLSVALQIFTVQYGDTVLHMITDNLSGITANEWTVADDILTYRNMQS